MAQIPHVNPGEVIRASLINQLIDAANAGGGTTVPSGVAVPDLFSRTLSQARSLLSQPAVNLPLGATIDAFGTIVDPNAPSSASRVVVGQSPSAGARVPVGTPVSVVLAAQGTGSGPAPKPVITGFSAATTPVGQPVTILGDNFDLTAANNTVTFDGVPAGVPNPSTKTTLTVIVPPIPGVPKSANVIVATPGGGSSVPAPTNVAAQLPGPNPAITSVDPSPLAIAQVGPPLKIKGSNFSATAANNSTMFDLTPGPVPTAASTTELTLIVPAITGVNSGNPPKAVTLTVKVGANSSSPFSMFVEKP
jgi:IPT/TIG domain/PASTA domain